MSPHRFGKLSKLRLNLSRFAGTILHIPAERLANPVIVLFFFLVGAALYFVPTFVSASRKTVSNTGIILLNVFLGWTFIGWVAALIWAVTAETQWERDSRSIDYARLAAAVHGGYPATNPGASPRPAPPMPAQFYGQKHIPPPAPPPRPDNQ
jgi:hypothetical protein